jgi:signal transduction histidine kinase
MIRIWQIFILLLLSSVSWGSVPYLIKIDTSKNSYDVFNNVKGVEELNTSVFESLIGKDKFKSIKELDPSAPVHWIKLTILNRFKKAQPLYLAVPFSDSVQLYSIDFSGKVNIQKSGDLVPLDQRGNRTGQMVIVNFTVPASSVQSYYLKLQGNSEISKQFKPFTLRSIELYSQRGFDKRFKESRLIQAFYYGAVIIMLLYNLIIFFILRYRSYSSYVVFLLSLIVFLASNNGYLVELLWPNFPRFDLYLRFLSTPFLLAAYLGFSQIFLESSIHAKKINTVINLLLIYFMFSFALMLSGEWFAGRSFVIVGGIISFIVIFICAIRVYRKGNTPAGYFILGNFLLLIGGVVYALERIDLIAFNLLSQYSLQISSVIQLALFSIGLADRINLSDKQLVEQRLVNAQLEKESEIEKKIIIEEKNRELEIKVKERTQSLEEKNKELEIAQHLIKEQNEELAAINTGLEAMVQSRTKELNMINEALERSNKELDFFIYRTAHDIRGPLARVLGLCHVGLLEIADDTAIDYLKKLQVNAQSLNHILSRLSAVYQINTIDIKYEPINLSQLTQDILKELTFYEGFENLSFFVKVSKKQVVETDKRLLKFVLMNLIENAIKFQKLDSPQKGKVWIDVSQKDGRIIVNIKDDGIGIPPEDVPNIFEMFSRAALKYNNAGLGLYMVKISVEKLNGKIEVVENAEGLTEIQAEIPIPSDFTFQL